MTENILKGSEIASSECENLKNKIYELNIAGNLIAGKLLNAIEVMVANGYSLADAKQELLSDTIKQAESELKQEIGETEDFADQVAAVEQAIEAI